jgi:hypothetical protein
MNASPNRSLPPILTDKLADFRRKVRYVKFAEGILAALFGLGLSWLLVFILDRLGETPVWLRTTLLVAGAAVPGLGLPLIWHRWVWRQRRLEDVARLVRRTFPRLGDQLLGIVELAHENHAETGRSERLVQAAIAQAADAVKDKDLSGAVPEPRARRWGLAAAGLAALAVAAGFLVPEASRNALMRWLMPWSDTARYTFAQVDELPKTLVVPYAENFEIPASLKEETRWTPSSASARIPGQPKVKVGADGKAYPFAFSPQKEDTRIDFKVGDDRERVILEPRTRPELTNLTAKLRLPEYLKYRHEPEIEVRGGSARLLGDAKVSWVAQASRELASAQLNGQAQPVEGGKLVTEYRPVEKAAELEIDWRDTLGLGPKAPLRLKVEPVKDEAPGISARRETQEQVVLNTEVVAFDLSVRDDFGIRRTGLEWTALPGQVPKGGGEPARGEKITAAGDAEMRDLETRATFSADKEGVKPQSVEVRAWAEDFLPDRERTYSASFVLHILDATDHALWLTTQFGKWLEAARETYEREQQLHETNQELRQLSAADLDRPENRRAIAKQAAEENANASRLDTLNEGGKRLVEQGTRNPEFDAERLESWATMLKQLDDIAAKRMPSVADLLKQSSGAKGAPKSGDAPPKPSDPSVAQNPADPNAEPPKGEGGKSKPQAPSVKNGGDLPSAPGEAKPVDPNAPETKPVPSIADNEKGFLDPVKPDKPEDGKAKPPGQGNLGLPGTTLGAIAGEKKPAPPESEAQEQLDNAIDEQRDLLAEFAKVADQLSDLLASLEASTFVKRLKAASRAQMEIAGNTVKETMSAFGLDRKVLSGAPVVAADELAKRARKESETVFTIQSDLAAYTSRKPDQRFTGLLEEMKKTEVIRELEAVAFTLEANRTGQSVLASEYWADTLDRWAEDLVSAAQSSSSSSGSKDSLPPEIVLKVMQALHDEMALRDETRELEKAKPAIDEIDFFGKAALLSNSQRKTADLVQSALDDIRNLPNGEQNFGKEAQLLAAVNSVMHEARAILAQPNTGDPAIAAETEAIELLLQARRQNPNGGGGGGGGDPGGGGSAASASSAALADLGPGSDAKADPGYRPVGQATGRTGREFPEEFRNGLDAYFGALEKAGGAKR